MSLIANKETKTKIENRLNEYSKVGITLYYLYEQNRVNINDLKNVFFSEDDEKSCFIYGNIIKHVKTKDIKEMKEKYNIINFFKENKLGILIFNIASSLLLTVGLCLGNKEMWWYNTTIIVPLGVFWALYRNQINQKLTQKKFFNILGIISVLIMASCWVGVEFLTPQLISNPSITSLYIIVHYLMAISCMLVILLFTYMFCYGNKMLLFLNAYAFYFYSLQTLTFEAFKDGVYILAYNRYLYFFLCLTLTIVLSVIVKFLYDKFWKYTFGKIQFKSSN